MTPWNRSGSGITGSPFVQAFSTVGIPYAASVMNLVVITAALSSSNTDLYLTTRMLFSLSRGHYAPEWLGHLSNNGVPRRALAVSTGGMIAAILLAIYAPSRAFLMLYGVAVAGMLFVWVVILLTHIAFRRALGPERIARLPLRLHFFPYSTLLGICCPGGNCRKYVLCRRPAIYGSRFSSVPPVSFGGLLESQAQWRSVARLGR
jgi:L-asparagine transporter-like permease